MAETLRCGRCGDENPADAHFCIDCGAALAPAATGPTARLQVVPCPSCRALNPERAHFCVMCGRGLVAGAAPRPRPPQPPAQQSHPRVAARPVPIRVTPPHYAAPRVPHLGPLVFLGGLLLLIATHSIWPGILLLIGVTSLINQSDQGRPDKGLKSIIWWGGLAFLFATGTFWPGILLLLVVSKIAGGWGHSHRRGCW